MAALNRAETETLRKAKQILAAHARDECVASNGEIEDICKELHDIIQKKGHFSS